MGQWRLSKILRPSLSLRQFSFLPFPLVGSGEGLGKALSPTAKRCVAIYAHKSTLMFNVYYHVQKSTCMQSSATVGRNGLHAICSSMALKTGSVHIWTPTARKWGSGPHDLTGSPPLRWLRTYENIYYKKENTLD